MDGFKENVAIMQDVTEKKYIKSTSTTITAPTLIQKIGLMTGDVVTAYEAKLHAYVK